MTELYKPKAYIASPYGFAESTKDWYNGTFLPMVGKYVDPIDPWSVDVSHILKEPNPDRRASLWVDLGEYHYKTIKEESELVIAGLDQEPTDTGTVCEVAWAAAFDKPIIGYRSDIRTAGEEGLPFNLMLCAAIRNSGGLLVASMAELEEVLAERYPQTATTG